jgi:uncharacterized protein
LSIEQQSERVALFPLHTVLFPGCTLPLQIFEQRYLRLVKTSLQNEQGFVVILISAGKEVGEQPDVFSIGCYVNITDWESLDNGLLGITIQGQHRVRVSNPCAQHDGLLMAEATPLPDDTAREAELLEEYSDLTDTLKHLEQHPFIAGLKMQFDYDSCTDVCNKLSYLLPASNQMKQSLLEVDSLEQRMQMLRSAIAQLQA